MAYASKSGHATTSSKRPRAFGVCYRCGRWWNRDQLNFQHDWRGTTLKNLYILVCNDCYDTPQEQLRSIVLPADPVPVYFPSVEQFEADETNYRSTAPVGTDANTGLPVPSTTLRVTQDCQNRITQPIGSPNGLEQNAVMPYNGGVQMAYGKPLALLSVIANGTTTIFATCSKPHQLATDYQISAEGLSNAAACGMFSVTVVNPIVFKYELGDPIPAASLLTGSTLMVTVLVGLPYGSKQIPIGSA